MLDFKLDSSGDLEFNAAGEITTTESIVQAVRVRLLWFAEEWRLGPGFGVPYNSEILVKNPNEQKVKARIREAVLSVTGVTDVTEIILTIDRQTRSAKIAVTFTADEETFREEVSIKWQNMA